LSYSFYRRQCRTSYDSLHTSKGSVSGPVQLTDTDGFALYDPKGF
jgi:hypothetical protein